MYLEQAGHQIDAAPNDGEVVRIRARIARHLVERACTDALRSWHGPMGRIHLQCRKRFRGAT